MRWLDLGTHDIKALCAELSARYGAAPSFPPAIVTPSDTPTEIVSSDGSKGDIGTTKNANGSGPEKHVAVIEGVVKAIVDSKVHMTAPQKRQCADVKKCAAVLSTKLQLSPPHPSAI